MPLRSIVHLDADAFFAAVEQASDPKLRGRPIAVGGEQRGIIASASYEARRFGIYTPMPTSRARKLCPKLLVLPGDFERYEQFSNWMFGYCYDFTPDVEQTSIDEGYYDLSGTRRPAAEIALAIRKVIGQKLKITVSEGIGSNKLVSAIASKLTKPAAFQEVPAGQETAFLHPLPNRWLPGIGPKTGVRLDAAGLTRIRHVAVMPLEMLGLLLGRQAAGIRQFARGIDDRPLIPAREPQKSFSQQETFARDLTDEEYLEAVLRRMADQLFAKVREEGRSVRTLTVKVRYNDMAEDQVSESLPEPTDLETDVYGRLHTMLRAAWKRRVSLRLVSLKLSNVYDSRFRSELALEVSAQRQNARSRLARVIDELRQARGPSIILRAHDFVLQRGVGRRESGVGSRESEVRAEVNGGGREVVTPPSLPSPLSPLLPPDSRLPTPDSRLPSPLCHLPSATCPLPSYSSHSPLSALRSPAAVCVPLRCHSHYSFLDSTLSPTALVRLAREHGAPAAALTDTGNLHGAVEFVQAAKEAGIRPILGVELRVGDQPLLLYVESTRGYANLCKLLSRHAERTAAEAEEVSVAAQQRRPFRIGELDGFTDGLIGVGTDPRLAPLFPKSFYRLVIARELPDDFPAVAAPPIHYATPADRQRYDILQSIRTLTLLQQGHPGKRQGGRLHYRRPKDLAGACREHPEWLRHTGEIAERCRFELPFGKPQFPAYAPPDGSSPGAFLRRLVIEGLRQRYGPRADRLRPQVFEELGIIQEVGYEEYFLITWDFLQDCRRRGIEWITRGSAADSLVCYCLGISSVCPVRFDLYFRRFLNRERMALNKLPDIDIDFAHDLKDDVVRLIFEKYGRDHCAVVGGFSTFQARSAFAEAAKVLGVAEREVRKFTDHFPWSFGGGWVPDEPTPGGGAGLIEMLRASPENRDLPLDEEPYRTALHMAEFLDGMPRYPKMHPCGLVLSRQPMHELTPTFIAHKGYAATHFDMDAVETIGLVKMDILAQGGLAAMRDVRASLAKRGIAVDLETCTAWCEAVCSSEHSFPLTPALSRGEREKNRTPQPASSGNEKLDDPHVETPLHHRQGFGRTRSLRIPRERETPAPVGWTVRSPGALSDGTGEQHEATQPPDSLSHRMGEGWGEGNEPWKDPAVWKMIAGGGARAVHHIESPAMTSLCRMCNVSEIDGLIAIVSVIRPGAANEGKKLAFTRRYQGLEPVTYPHPSLEACLRSTYGLVVYEEHILQLCEAFAGLDPGRADVLRRALNKQKRAVIEEIRGEFFASARGRGHSPEKTAEVWELVTGFAGYAFCKAHSTAYGVEAYQSAWLKRYFPAAFMAAVLTNGKGFYHPIVYVLECHRLGLTLLPPSVNAPGPEFKTEVRSQKSEDGRWEVEDGGRRTEDCSGKTVGSTSCFIVHPSDRAIRVPLTRMKGLTERTIDRLLEARDRGPFVSMFDFYPRVASTSEELEAMIRVGAFDEFGDTRTRQFWQAQQLLGGKEGGRRKAEDGRMRNAEFSFVPVTAPASSFFLQHSSLLEEPTRRERLQWETDLFGYAVSGHPLELFADVAWDTYCPVNRLGEFVGQTVTACGLVVEQRIHHQITGEPMKFLTLADWTGMVETELFAQTYKSYGLATVRYPVLEVEARVEPFENGRGFSLRALRAGRPRTLRNAEGADQGTADWAATGITR